MNIDTRELTVLANDLVDAGDEVVGEARKVIQRGALNIKNQLRDEASGHVHAPRLPYAITYDTQITRDGIEAEIGPLEGGAGSLAFYYYGNAKTGPILPDPKGALDAEAGNVEKYLGGILAGLL